MPSYQIIGFELWGTLSNNLPSIEGSDPELKETYDIEIYPKVSIKATVTYSERYENKPIPLQIPGEMRDADFEKTFSLLYENDLKPMVIECGHEKIGNRTLLIEFTSNLSESIANSSILVRGQSNAIDYQIHLNPHDILQSTAEILDNHSKDYRKIPLHLGEIRNLDPLMTKKILRKLKVNNFYVAIDGDQLFIHLAPTLRQFLTKPHLLIPRKAVKKTHTEDFTKEDIVISNEVYSKGSIPPPPPPHHATDPVMEEVKFLIAHKDHPTNEFLNDISRTIDHLYLHECADYVSTLLNAVGERFAIDQEILRTITPALYRMRMILLKEESNRQHFESKKIPSHPLSSENLLSPLSALVKSLQASPRKECSLVSQQIEASIELLHLLSSLSPNTNVTQVCKDTYGLIKQVKQDQAQTTFHLSYLCQYSLEAFDIVHNPLFDFSRWCDCFASAFSILTKIEAIEKPWLLPSKLVQIVKNAPDHHPNIISRLHLWEKKDTRWLLDLITIHRIILDPSPEIFINFAKEIENDPSNIQKDMDLHHPFFVFGLTELVWKTTHYLESEWLNPKVKTKASALLKMIYLSNSQNDPSLPFHLSHVQARNELKTNLETIIGENWNSRINSRFVIHRSHYA